MKAATHLSFGVLSGVVYSISTAVNVDVALTSIAMFCIGSLLPDIDSKSSTITNLLVIPKYLPLKHRGFMHSVTVCAMVCVVNVPLGLGMLSHVTLDLLNHRKIKLFAPFCNKKFALKICKSDGVIDQMIRALSIGATVMVLLY